MLPSDVILIMEYQLPVKWATQIMIDGAMNPRILTTHGRCSLGRKDSHNLSIHPTISQFFQIQDLDQRIKSWAEALRFLVGKILISLDGNKLLHFLDKEDRLSVVTCNCLMLLFHDSVLECM